MIFNRLKLTNFGGHKELDFPGLTSCVGIVGPSGRGKTTILNSVELLLRAAIEGADAVETFIRDFGSPYAAEYMQVEGWFVDRLGKEGYLMRRYGKAPKRRLVYDGVAIGEGLAADGKGKAIGEGKAKEEDIAKKLEELFGIGKKSLISTVFLKQGEISDALFTTPIKREDHMLRILNLEHMPRVADAASKEKARLLEGMPDMTPALDQATFTYNAAHQECEQATLALKTAYDYTADLAALRARDMHTAELSAATLAVSGAQAEFETARLALAGQLAEAPGFPDLAALAAAMEEARQRKEDARLELAALVSRNDLIQQREQTRTQAGSVRTTQAALATKITQLQGLYDAAEETRLQIAVNNAHQREAANAKVVALSARVVAGEAVLDGMGARPEVLDTSALRATLGEACSRLKPSLDLWDQLSRAGLHQGNHECPTCHQDASKVIPEPAVLQAARLEHDTAQRQLGELLQAQNAETAAQAQWDYKKALYEQTLTSLREQLGVAENEYAALEATAPLQELQNRLTSMQTLGRNLTQAQADQRAQLNQLEQLERQLATFAPDLAPVPQDVTTAAAAAQTTHQEFLNLNGRHSLVTSLVGRLAQTQAVLTEAERRTAAAAQQLNQSVLPQMAIDALAVAGGDLQAALHDLTARQTRWLSAFSLQERASQMMADANNRMQAIQNTIDQQAVRRVIAGKLERVAKAFGRGGIPAQIVQNRWNLLIALTQSYLRQSESPFSIRVSETQAVSLEFMIHKRAYTGYRPMTKMSGGERMRFAVNFSLASQQLLTPELGLLSLDEPSTHLDDPSKHQLAEIIGSLHTRLQNACAQIWVCDHSPLLIPAFTSCIVLPPLENEEPDLTAPQQPAMVSDAVDEIHPGE